MWCGPCPWEFLLCNAQCSFVQIKWQSCDMYSLTNRSRGSSWKSWRDHWQLSRKSLYTRGVRWAVSNAAGELWAMQLERRQRVYGLTLVYLCMGVCGVWGVGVPMLQLQAPLCVRVCNYCEWWPLNLSFAGVQRSSLTINASGGEPGDETTYDTCRDYIFTSVLSLTTAFIIHGWTKRAFWGSSSTAKRGQCVYLYIYTSIRYYM